MKFILTTPLTCFPSDNALDSMPRRERFAIKRTIKDAAHILTLSWLSRNKIRSNSLSKAKPLFSAPVRIILTVYLKKGRTIDVHNLSIKAFLDQLVQMRIIADDSIKEIPEAVARFGGFVKKQSFAEFEIEEIKTADSKASVSNKSC